MRKKYYYKVLEKKVQRTHQQEIMFKQIATWSLKSNSLILSSTGG